MTIHFLPQKTHLKPIDVSESEALEKSLMALLLAAGLPVASSCQGDGICSKCRIQIIKGEENLSPALPLENKTKTKNKVTENERLACQTRISGSVLIDTPYW